MSNEDQPGSRLIDPFGRRIDYVRLSVTDRCNYRCSYCLPERFKGFEKPDHWLTFDEIERVIHAFTELGTRRVRITGGEPLARKNLHELAGRLNELTDLDDLSLSTNASLLRAQAQNLYDAGVRRINVSLDSLDPERFAEITGGGLLGDVLDGLQVAHDTGFDPIKINMVAMRGINDDEFEGMVEYCLEKGFTLRIIETMPVGSTGVTASADYVDLREVRERLSQRFDLVDGLMPGGGPARYMKVRGTDMHIGFITPMSQHFCETCNRVRLSVDGTLYLCLGQEDKLELRPLMRQGISDEDLKHEIVAAIARKPERHDFNESPGQVVRFMSMTGG